MEFYATRYMSDELVFKGNKTFFPSPILLNDQRCIHTVILHKNKQSVSQTSPFNIYAAAAYIWTKGVKRNNN